MAQGPADYLPGGFQDIRLPSPPSWEPEAPGWWVLLALILLALSLFAIRHFRQWRANRYRRMALRQLDMINPSDVDRVARIVAPLLKVTALHAYPRKMVAPLTGEAWLDFLDRTYDGPSFQSDPGWLLVDLSYKPADKMSPPPDVIKTLLEMAKLWVRTHDRGHAERCR